MVRQIILLAFFGIVSAQLGLGKERPSFCTGAECPDLEVLCTYDGYQVRRYPSSKWVSTTVRALTTTEANTRGFWKLYAYIQGSNDQGVKIAMTTPVLTEISRRQSSWAMKDYTVSFYLPKEFWENVPNPIDPKVFIKESKAFIAYVVVFDGFATDPIPYRKSEELVRLLETNKEPYATGYYYSAGYDRPTKLVDRHNEVWLVLANDLVDTYTCKATPAEPENPITIEQCKTTECPSFKLLNTYDNGLEKRRYDNVVVVTKEIQSCWYEMASMEGFWALFRYISGENDREIKIPMTAPVALAVEEKSKSSTRDKNKEADDKQCNRVFSMSFYIPKQYQSNPPQPTEEGVSIKKLDNITVYVKTYGGWATELVMEFKHRQATRELDSLELCYAKEQFLSLGYDDPTTLFNRRNEIWLLACENDLSPVPNTEGGDTEISPRLESTTAGILTESDTTIAHEAYTTSRKIVAPVDTLEEIAVGQEIINSFSFCADRNIECPEFNNVERDGEVTERKYGETKWIGKTLQACDINEANMLAARPLVNYFNGMNTRELKIPMTAPILTTLHPSSLTERGCNDTYTVSFFIPREFEENTPEPEDDDLHISVLMPRVFVKSFDSLATVRRIEETTIEMKGALVDDGECQSIDPTFFYVAGYNRPFSSHQPYSEVWIPTKFCFEDDIFNVERQLNRLKKQRLFADPKFDGLEYKPPVCSESEGECPPYTVDRIQLHYEERTYKLAENINCFVHASGVDYRGELLTTVSGKTCQKWSEQTPHEHSRLPENFPYGGLGEHNFCRNPDAEPRPWCYTTDPDTRWDYCDVGEAGEHCGTMWACVETKACNFRSAFRQTHHLLANYANRHGNQDGIEFKTGLPQVYQMKISDLNKPSCDKQFRVCSYLTQEFQDSPPQPTDLRVTIGEMPLSSFYVAAFGGHISDDVIRREVHNLQSHLDDDGLDDSLPDVVFTATYNSPMRIEDRYNEIWIPIPRE